MQRLDALDADPFFNFSKISLEETCEIRLKFDDRSVVEPPFLVVEGFQAPTALPGSIPPGHRPFPHDLKEFKVEETSLYTNQPLRIGMDEWSQVWLGSMARNDSSHTWPVVIKIFQQSFFPCDDYYAAADHEFNNDNFARNEAAAFMILADLQGSEIPWSYGFYKFRLPHGEIAFGHVMEFFPGPRGDKIHYLFAISERLPLKEETWMPMLESLTKTVHKIRRRGIQHNDLSLQNILFTNHLSKCVIIDFAFAVKAPEKRWSDTWRICDILEDFEVPEWRVGEWYQDHLDDDWASDFAGRKFRDDRIPWEHGTRICLPEYVPGTWDYLFTDIARQPGEVSPVSPVDGSNEELLKDWSLENYKALKWEGESENAAETPTQFIYRGLRI
ncbi:hypothetical protein C8J56DRAFT_979337 [Mycena floridula]|nr:hypothetical protein C8J56DRAFT_979337 [Mycena floridula]